MSFEFELDEKEQARAELMGRVGTDLQSVFLHRKDEDGLTQAKLAEELGVDRSRVNRCLSGFGNLTLATISDLSFSMNAKVIIKIIPNEDAANWTLSWSNSRPPARYSAGIASKPETVNQQAAVGVWRR